MKTKNLIEAFVSFGAAVVVLGALFKLEHLPFASSFLWVGLGIEAVIFCIYGFQELFKKHKKEIMFGADTFRVPDVPAQSNEKLTNAIENLTQTIKQIFNR